MTDRATQVREVMTADPLVIAPEATLDQAHTTMKDGGFRHLPVQKEGKLVGVLSMTDIGRLGQSVPALMARPVSELMTPDPVTVGPDELIEAAAAQMALRKVNCLPVVEGGRLVGIVTTYDLLDALVRRLAPRSSRNPAPQ